ncbi:ATP-dependent nuclease [Mucilaginibacter sp. UYCu711]|uniref:ATP-dependent nuclease n=1 Tax=Mucilaginibacter sp. UYCu711 TaxID=3156339 RepID=UPI003D1E14B7
MKILSTVVNNYRNLDQISLKFDSECNFLVGENNLGKTNLLTLLNILFTSRAFQFDDFFDITKPIEIAFQLSLAEAEIGHFQDLFDAADYSLINISAVQESPEDSISFYHTETSTFIAPAQLRNLNFIYYSSLRNPASEINFTSGKGIGKFLRNMIAQHLTDEGITDAEFLDVAKVSKLLVDINKKVSKIKAFKDFNISAHADDNKEDLLSKIIVFNDDKGDSLSKTGYGVQFLILITLSILEKLYAIKEFRGEKGIFVDDATGKRTISLVLGLDEPEIHLHPYMQRSLIKYLCALVDNKNEGFSELVKELFDVDQFTGQVIVVTHSPNIILNNFKQIVRFYNDDGKTRIVSGSNITLDAQLSKHLLIHFPFIKEAFFSRCAIFVEGASEISSFPGFASKLSVDLDEFGICVIQAGGDAVKQLMDIAAKFAIPSVGINDRDDKTGVSTVPDLFWTDKRNFEDELITLIDQGKENILRAILAGRDSEGAERIMEVGALNKKAIGTYKITATPFTAPLKLADIAAGDNIVFKCYYATWFTINKGFPLGLLIGQHLGEPEIPTVYKNLIALAKSKAI